MIKTCTKPVTISCLAILLATCGSPQENTIATNQPETISAADQQAADLQAAAITREFISTCVKLGGHQSEIANEQANTSKAPAVSTSAANAKPSQVWSRNVEGKEVQFATAVGMFKGKPTKECSVVVKNTKIDAFLAQIASMTSAKRSGTSIFNGQYQRLFTMDDAGQSYTIIASDETKTGSVTLTSRIVGAPSKK